MKFSSMGLSPEIQQALKACGYDDMTPVQEQAIPLARKGRDLMVNAQTGTGKTAAFALPLLQQMIDQPKETAAGKVRALILTPTRELAEQLAVTIGGYADNLPFNITAVYGGVKHGGQANKLKAGVDILIATPGRLIEHIEMNHVSLSQVEFVVLDEADRMLDMGFINDVQALMAQTAAQKQTLLFSATSSPAVNELSHKILKRPVDVRVDKQNTTAQTVEHVVYPVDEERKLDLFMELLEEHNWFQILVFTSTKKQADHLLDRLKQTSVKAALCHADKSQGARRRALAEFKAGDIQVLVSTEIAARGLDIEGLDHVLNYNLPFLPEDYVHRIGRTGRAGKPGQAISFVCPQETRFLAKIQRVIGDEIKRIYQRGFELKEREVMIQAPVKKASKKSTKKDSAASPKKGAGKSAGKGKNTAPKARKKSRSISSRAGGKKSRAVRKKAKK